MFEKEFDKPSMEAAFQAWDKHGLNDHVDTIRGGALVLFEEAIVILSEVCSMVCELDGVSENVLRLAREATLLARDACLIAAIDPEIDPEEGMVECLPGGQYRWRRR